MQTNSQPKLLPVPFADAGSKQNIPNDSQIGITAGRASYVDGFPPLTRTPLAAGGMPPFGTDFNGVLNDITAALRWSQSGAGYPFNAAFNTAISGYPKGAKIPNSTLDGYWLNTVDGNSANPEAAGAVITGWVPTGNYGITTISGLSGSSVTLSTLQASKDRIILTGTLSSNINLTVPAWVKTWTFVNNCTGSFLVTVKTPTGTGVPLSTGQSATLVGDGTNILADFLQPRLARFTSSGSFTVPVGVTTVYLSGCAGGGGGGAGGGGNASFYGSAGSGGGAGQGVIKQSVFVTPGQVIPVNVGSAGTAGIGDSSGGTAASVGGVTSFGSLLTLTGGGAGGNGSTTSSGGVPGALNSTGYPGGSAGGDGSATTGSAMGGNGGSCAFGGGGGGSRASSSSGYAASSAYGYGGGGGGGGGHYGNNNGTYSGGSGGAGSPGILILEW